MVLRTSPIAMAVFDHEMRYQMANEAWLEQFDLQGKAPIEGKSHFELFPNLHEGWKQLYFNSLAGNFERFDDLVESDAGEKQTVRWELRPCKLPPPKLDENDETSRSNSPSHGLMVSYEVVPSSPKNLQLETLSTATSGAGAEAEDLHAVVAENSPLALVLLNKNGHVLYTNPQVVSILGTSLALGYDMTAWIESHCPDQAHAAEVLGDWQEGVLRQGDARIFSLANQEGLLKEIRFHPRPLEDGRLLVCITDVTESRRSEEALRATESRYHLLFKDSPVPMALLESTGYFYHTNQALSDLLGVSGAILCKSSLRSFLAGADVASKRKALDEMATTGKVSTTLELRLRKDDGSFVRCKAAFSRISDDEQLVRLTACFFQPLEP